MVTEKYNKYKKYGKYSYHMSKILKNKRKIYAFVFLYDIIQGIGAFV